jgi:hypothetical protein
VTQELQAWQWRQGEFVVPETHLLTENSYRSTEIMSALTDAGSTMFASTTHLQPASPTACKSRCSLRVGPLPHGDRASRQSPLRPAVRQVCTCRAPDTQAKC